MVALSREVDQVGDQKIPIFATCIPGRGECWLGGWCWGIDRHVRTRKNIIESQLQLYSRSTQGTRG
jgi:hypothetical protein